MNRRHLSWLLGAALTAALTVPATWLLFTQFMVYDDEGYVLWSLKNYTELGALYTKVYSQYGPAFFAAYDAIHRVTGLAFTNDNGRWITLFFWCGTAFVAGEIAALLTRSVSARLAAIALTFAALFAMSSEPSHPGGPLAFLSAVVAWAGVRAILARRPLALALACGALGAAMLLTKINVGVFVLIASGSWLALHGPLPEAKRRLLGLLVLLGAVASPALLMLAKLGDPRYAGFAALFAASSGALALRLRWDAHTVVGRRDWAGFAAAAVAVATVVGAAVLARGTTWNDLVTGVAIAPFRQTAVYSFPPREALPAVALALAGLATTAWLTTRPALPSGATTAIAWLRLLAVPAVAIVGLSATDHAVSRALFFYGSALAWLFAWPLREESSPTGAARLWLAWVFVWQTLHAFPVAGSQVAWGSLLAAPLGVVGVAEAIAVVFPAARRRLLAQGLLLAAALTPCVVLARAGWSYRQASAPLGLPGARRLLPPPNIAHALRALARNVDLHGHLLFSHPGMFSFNLWTGHPTPTAANVTLWSTLLSDEQQKEIQTRLAADPRAVVISQQYVLGVLIGQGFAPRGDLNQFLVHNFSPAFRLDTYVFWVRRDRTIAPVGTARLEPAGTDHGVAVELITDAAGHATAWELWSNGLPLRLAHGPLDGARGTFEPLSSDGRATGEARPLGDGALPGKLGRVRFPLPPLRLPSPDDLELRLLNAEGRTIESAPFRR